MLLSSSIPVNSANIGDAVTKLGTSFIASHISMGEKSLAVLCTDSPFGEGGEYSGKGSVSGCSMAHQVLQQGGQKMEQNKYLDLS